MDDVKRDTGNNPGDCPFQVQPEQERLRRGAQCPKQEPMRRADGHVNGGLRLFRQFLRKQHNSAPENCPYIQICEPPSGKTAENTVQDYIDVNGIERFFAINNRISNGQRTQQVNVRQQLHQQFGSEHHRPEHPKHCRFPDGQFHPFSTWNA